MTIQGDGLLVLRLPRATVGLVVRDGYVVDAPPYVRWALNRWADGVALKHEYTWMPGPAGKHCHHCGLTSYHPVDVRESYCGACHHYCQGLLHSSVPLP